MTFDNLNVAELNELRWTLFYNDPDAFESIDDISMDDLREEYGGIDFVKDDFACNQEDEEHPLSDLEVIEELSNLNDIRVERVGKWLWVSGNTFAHKAVLKSLGLYYSKQKKMWYWKPENAKPIRYSSKYSFARICDKYGSEIIQSE